MQVEFKMRYINHWIDDLGRHRYRFRRKGLPGVELPVDSDPNSVEFQAAYHAALRGEKTNAAVAAITARGGSGSVKDAIERYLDSTTFNDDYSPSTKALRRSILNSVSRLVGKLPLAQMDRNWIERWLETAPTKGVKRTRLLAVKPFTKWAVESVHLMASDPTEGIKVRVRETDGHPTWTDEQIEQYRAHHPLGTKARLALEGSSRWRHGAATESRSAISISETDGWCSRKRRTAGASPGRSRRRCLRRSRPPSQPARARPTR